MGIERVGSKTDVIIKLVLVFFISLLSFSIGTFVGKKFSDNQHRLAKMEPTGDQHGTEGNREVASAHEEKTGTENLTDEDIAKLAEEFVDTGKTVEHAVETETAANETKSEGTHEAKAEAAHVAAHPEAKTEASHNVVKAEAPAKSREVASTKAKEVKKEESSEAAVRIAEGKTPSEAPKKEVHEVSKVATTLPKEVATSTAGKFTVQIASYPSEPEAQKMASQLKEKGFSAFYLPAQVTGKTWYRVSVGLFATQKEAQEHKAELMEKANVNTAIISKIAQ